jgi:hypothetical protein
MGGIIHHHQCRRRPPEAQPPAAEEERRAKRLAKDQNEGWPWSSQAPGVPAKPTRAA